LGGGSWAVEVFILSVGKYIMDSPLGGFARQFLGGHKLEPSYQLFGEGGAGRGTPSRTLAFDWNIKAAATVVEVVSVNLSK
jgi:hypothetical protein